MDVTALLNDGAKEVLGYGVLGVAVIALAILFWFERVDRKAADQLVDKVKDDAAAALEAYRKDAQAKIDSLQDDRINEMKAAIASIRAGEDLMRDMQGEITGVREALKMLADALGRNR